MKRPRKRSKTQEQLVIGFIAENGKSTIDEVHAATEILRPNIRRILGEGAKKGKFERIAPGVYVLKTEAGNIAYVETADALHSLPRLIKEGWKFDMVFVDPPYYATCLVGSGNRSLIDYDFIYARQFAKVMEYVSRLLKSTDSHVYIMLSGAATAQKEMKNYIRAVEHAGLKLVGEGKYKKTYKSGRPTMNVRGTEASAERLFLYTLSGQAAQYGCKLQMNFTVVRPTGYQTEKSPVLLSQLIRQGMPVGGWMLDTFTGSGVSGDEALKAGCNAYLIDKNTVTVEIILNRISEAVD